MALRHAVWVVQQREEEERRREALLASAVQERRMLMEEAARARREPMWLLVSWCITQCLLYFSAQDSVKRRRQERWKGKEQSCSDCSYRWSLTVK